MSQSSDVASDLGRPPSSSGGVSVPTSPSNPTSAFPRIFAPVSASTAKVCRTATASRFRAYVVVVAPFASTRRVSAATASTGDRGCERNRADPSSSSPTPSPSPRSARSRRRALPRSLPRALPLPAADPGAFASRAGGWTRTGLSDGDSTRSYGPCGPPRGSRGPPRGSRDPPRGSCAVCCCFGAGESAAVRGMDAGETAEAAETKSAFSDAESYVDDDAARGDRGTSDEVAFAESAASSFTGLRPGRPAGVEKSAPVPVVPVVPVVPGSASPGGSGDGPRLTMERSAANPASGVRPAGADSTPRTTPSRAVVGVVFSADRPGDPWGPGDASSSPGRSSRRIHWVSPASNLDSSSVGASRRALGGRRWAYRDAAERHRSRGAAEMAFGWGSPVGDSSREPGGEASGE